MRLSGSSLGKIRAFLVLYFIALFCALFVCPITICLVFGDYYVQWRAAFCYMQAFLDLGQLILKNELSQMTPVFANIFGRVKKKKKSLDCGMSFSTPSINDCSNVYFAFIFSAVITWPNLICCIVL